MQHYREKTTIIEAMQFDPEHQPWPDCVIAWAGNVQHSDGTWGNIRTADGIAFVSAGDWIVLGASGWLRTCPDTVFRSMYEPVEVPLD